MPPNKWDAYDALVDPDETGPRLFFQRAPEGKIAKNRVHLDVTVGAKALGSEQRRASSVGVQYRALRRSVTGPDRPGSQVVLVISMASPLDAAIAICHCGQ